MYLLLQVRETRFENGLFLLFLLFLWCAATQMPLIPVLPVLPVLLHLIVHRRPVLEAWRCGTWYLAIT
jgi:hypothetical protein